MNLTKVCSSALEVIPYNLNQLMVETQVMKFFYAIRKFKYVLFQLYLKECVEKTEHKQERASPRKFPF